MQAITTLAIFFLASLNCAPVSAAVEVEDGTLLNADAYNEAPDQGCSTNASQANCDALPQLVKGHAPVYPRNLLRSEITGQAIIVFAVDVNGKVVRPVVESATNPEFAASAIAALSLWEFRPAKLRGKPIELEVRQIFPFQLR